MWQLNLKIITTQLVICFIQQIDAQYQWDGIVLIVSRHIRQCWPKCTSRKTVQSSSVRLSAYLFVVRLSQYHIGFRMQPRYSIKSEIGGQSVAILYSHVMLYTNAFPENIFSCYFYVRVAHSVRHSASDHGVSHCAWVPLSRHLKPFKRQFPRMSLWKGCRCPAE